MTKIADFDQYKYSGYDIGFDARGVFSLSVGSEFGFNVKIENITLTAEKEYVINFSEQHTTFCLTFHSNGANIFLFVNGGQIYKFKAKDSEINAAVGNVSKDF